MGNSWERVVDASNAIAMAATTNSLLIVVALNVYDPVAEVSGRRNGIVV